MFSCEGLNSPSLRPSARSPCRNQVEPPPISREDSRLPPKISARAARDGDVGLTVVSPGASGEPPIRCARASAGARSQRVGRASLGAVHRWLAVHRLEAHRERAVPAHRGKRK